MDSNDALVLIFSRNAFYKRLHYYALAAFGLSLLVIIALISVFIYLRSSPTKPIYFATDRVTHLISVVPVDTPNMTTEDVMAWAIDAVQAAYSYDYINYHAQIQDAQKYFTTFGWAQYMKALVASNNMLIVTQRRAIFTAQVIGKPTILAQGLLGGSYAWKFQMPMLLTASYPPYDSSPNTIFANALQVTVLVKRQPALQGYKGLGIVQLIVEYPQGK